MGSCILLCKPPILTCRLSPGRCRHGLPSPSKTGGARRTAFTKRLQYCATSTCPSPAGKSMPRLGVCVAPGRSMARRNRTAKAREYASSKLQTRSRKASAFGNHFFRRRRSREFSIHPPRDGGWRMADTILVVGATGMQGGGVARHLLKRGVFNVRCMTRCPDSEPAGLLKQHGAEVVQADLDNSGSIRRAVEGCKGVFGVTNFWEAYFRE